MLLAAEIIDREMYHVMLEMNNRALENDGCAAGLREALEILKGEPADA